MEQQYNYMVTLECHYAWYVFYVQVSTWIIYSPDSEQAQSNDGTFVKALLDEALLKYMTFTGAQQPDDVSIEDWYEVE